jgi:hypothetical protein
MRNILVGLASAAVALSLSTPAHAQYYCPRPALRTDQFDGMLSLLCEFMTVLQTQQSASQTTYNQQPNLVEFGRNIRAVYETAYTHTWPNGVRGFIGSNNSVYRISKQVASDGNVLYFERQDHSTRIFRYNATRDAFGYTDVWSYSIGNNYLKARVTMLTDYGSYLNPPQITQVETNDMYPGLRSLLDF